ncbi:uncharacterized protein [Procambarus clarkii]|uniref:uncharacterized protein n=1 Tax=Procambarus clarkii TaxID=6728 RepID=UPI003742C06D
MKLPSKLNHPQLPVNYFMAASQLKSQLAKLQKQPDKLNLYHELIRQQLNSKFIDLVDNDDHKTNNYLPHHAVMKESVTTPIRIVFNCSAKTKADSVSLNEFLQTEPSLTQRLQDVLLRIRPGNFSYTADISKAFLRVGLQEEDCNFTKFLWVKDPQDPNCDVITYRFASVLFGATYSPLLLQASLDTHLKKSNSPYKSEISNNLYVYNWTKGTTNDEIKLVEIYHEANCELLGANMPLQSWSTNNKQLNQIIGKEFPGYQVPNKLKALGMEWSTITDEMNVKSVQTNNSPLTMRKLLSYVSQPFDPVGLLSPILIRGKLLMQECWQKNMGWDDPLPIKLQGKRQTLTTDFNQLSVLKFPRNALGQNLPTNTCAMTFTRKRVVLRPSLSLYFHPHCAQGFR